MTNMSTVAPATCASKDGENLAEIAIGSGAFAFPGDPVGKDALKSTKPAALSTTNDVNQPEQSNSKLESVGFAAVPLHRKAELLKRFELPLLLIGAFGPALTLWAAFGRSYVAGAFFETSAALIVSISFSWYILSRLKDHANARHLSYVLPVNVLVVTGVFTVMALLRIPYSGSFFSMGASFGVAASFLFVVYGRRLVKPHVIVSGGRANEIMLTGQYLPAPAAGDLEHVIKTGRRDWVIVADLHYPHSENYERLFAKAALAGVPVYHFREIAEMQSGQVKISHLSENELGSLIPNVSYTSVKRLIDILAALLLIPLCIPIFAILALLIKLDSPGSAFFIQERMGFRGNTFRMIKFRTMRERIKTHGEIEQREDAMTKGEDDRITRIGRFLRKVRIDELPQVFNVLRGDMSFIGPRPEACSLSEWYDAELPFYSYRHIVRPGISGWAQVNQGHVTDVADVLAKLRFDFYYIKNISLWLDLLIALKTLRVIGTGLGAR